MGVNKKWLWISAMGFIAIAFFTFIYWFYWGRFETSTDDAYVNGNQVKITSQIEGYVVSIHADDTDLVEEGQILIELDKTDKIIALEKAKAVLGEKIREVTKLFENVYILASEYDRSNAGFVDAEIRYMNRREVVESGAISEEEYIRAETNYYAAKADVTRAKYQLMKAISEVQNTTVKTHPLVEKAKADIREAYLNLQRCTIRSPATGIVALRKVQIGQSITRQLPLLAVVPLNEMWVDANFKEVDLSNIRIGQSASIVSDIYGREMIYKGEVIGIGIGSGAVFSPLPPQNATGNWIKIVQRIPVRISLDIAELKKMPLRLGLSMNVSVNLRDKDGERIPPKTSDKSIYDTDVFQNQLKGVDVLIDEIFDQNESLEGL